MYFERMLKEGSVKKKKKKDNAMYIPDELSILLIIQIGRILRANF